LLPGALQKNAGLSFRCETVECTVGTDRSPLTALATPGSVLRLPINHFEGNYVCDEATRRGLHDDDRIVLRYVRNPNGSVDDIAGICSEQRNVVGLMPHPERAVEPLLGSTDGAVLLRSLLATASEGAAVA
jgi:phosphoribosylformylglycinamidine synthase